MPTRQQMKDLGQDIIGAHEDRTRRIAQLQDDVKMLKKNVGVTLDGYGKELKEMSATRAAAGKKLRDELTEGAADLRQDVGTLLQGLNQAHAAMGQEMKADLAKGVADRKRDLGSMLQGFGQELKDVHSARADASKKLRADLTKGAADLKEDVGTMLEGFDAAQAEVRSTLAGGRDEWQKLAATMQAKRGAPTVEAEPRQAHPRPKAPRPKQRLSE